MEDKHRIYHDRFVVFNVMWAFAHIAHLWNQAYDGDANLAMTPVGVLSFVVLLAAFLVALWPRNAKFLIVLCSVQLVQCFILRTEGGVNNHMFMPRLRLWTLQDEFAEIQSTTDTAFQRLAATQRYINYYELHRYGNKLEPNASLTYLRDGTSYHVNDATKHTVLTPPPYWVQKFMLFRPVAIDGPAQCGN